MLPGMDGYQVLEGVRARKQTPVLMLAARGSVDERVKGLRLGADDYLPKPFSLIVSGLIRCSTLTTTSVFPRLMSPLNLVPAPPGIRIQQVSD